jgi:hypothetical protein
MPCSFTTSDFIHLVLSSSSFPPRIDVEDSARFHDLVKRNSRPTSAPRMFKTKISLSQMAQCPSPMFTSCPPIALVQIIFSETEDHAPLEPSFPQALGKVSVSVGQIREQVWGQKRTRV